MTEIHALYAVVTVFVVLAGLLLARKFSPTIAAAEDKVVAEVKALEPAVAQKIAKAAVADYDAAVARVHSAAVAAKADAEAALADAEKAVAVAQAFKAALAAAKA